jgi:hypothetical protein
MKTSVALLLVLVTAPAVCHPQGLPPEVRAFLADRRTCEHFLGEVDEGNTPERAERQRFVSDSIDIYCAGTDKRLAALKRRYRTDAAVMKQLKAFEEKIE